MLAFVKYSEFLPTPILCKTLSPNLRMFHALPRLLPPAASLARRGQTGPGIFSSLTSGLWQPGGHLLGDLAVTFDQFRDSFWVVH